MPLIAVIGSINVDLVAHVERHPLPGETLLGRGGERIPGGKGANQALAATLQGGSVRLIGAVGADAEADIALALLKKAGTELSVATLDQPTGLALITVSDAGENTIIVLPGANHALEPAHAEAEIAKLPEDAIVVLQGELTRATTEAAARAAHARGLKIILNVAPWGDLDPDVLGMADPLVLNEHEAKLALASLGGQLDHVDDPVEEAEQIAARLLDRNIRSVIITLGPAGALTADATGSYHAPGVPATPVDTTGAGDAFVGALAARLAGGDSLPDAARWANRVGAKVTEKPGAQTSYPSADEIGMER